MDGNSLVSASTDNSVRLWDLRGRAPFSTPSSTGSGTTEAHHHHPNYPPQPRLAMSFAGHHNERNFVGLSVTPSGYIACGSENNRVYCYYKVGGGSWGARAGADTTWALHLH